MKNIIFMTFITFLFASCSNKEKGTGKFKLVVGSSAIEAKMIGGAFIEAQNISMSTKDISKLDATNTIDIVKGKYNFLFVTFLGPLDRSGTMYCSSVEKVELTKDTETIEVNLTTASCQQEKYTETILKIKNGIAARWNFDNFNQSYWGQ